jgi:hypothetical protein
MFGEKNLMLSDIPADQIKFPLSPDTVSEEPIIYNVGENE